MNFHGALIIWKSCCCHFRIKNFSRFELERIWVCSDPDCKKWRNCSCPIPPSFCCCSRCGAGCYNSMTNGGIVQIVGTRVSSCPEWVVAHHKTPSKEGETVGDSLCPVVPKTIETVRAKIDAFPSKTHRFRHKHHVIKCIRSVSESFFVVQYRAVLPRVWCVPADFRSIFPIVSTSWRWNFSCGMWSDVISSPKVAQ